jgi:sugar phosphate isomerase/epimerase
MSNAFKLSRRNFLATSGVLAGSVPWAGALPQDSEHGLPNQQEIPLKIGHRAMNMKMVGNFDIFKYARQIQGLMGVELQVAAGTPNLQDLDAVRHYKREANRWGMIIPSLAGVWAKGSSIRAPLAGLELMQAIRASELLGSSVILAAFYLQNVPNMNDESSYGPLVELLQKTAPYAADAGVTLGIENSMSPADNLKLVDLIDRPNVKVYYDIHNMAHYGYAAEAIPGIALLGKQRICQVHVKNEDHLITEPGLINWADAFAALNAIAYDGWFVFETEHTSISQMIEATQSNIEFMRKHCRMPLA